MKSRDILKIKNIIKILPDETLSTGLSYLSSSHDAAFVFSEDKKFMGVINPYHCLIKSSYPGNAKVEHCVFHAPRIRANYPTSKVAQLMSESRVHYLPVFDERNNFIGINSARHILFLMRDSNLFNIKIDDYLKIKNRPLMTIFDSDLVSQAIHQFKTHKISKLVVINREMKLRGILTQYDLIRFLITPKKKEHRGEREGDRISFQYHQVKNFAKSYVLTLYPENLMSEALNLILDKEIGSVVIIDKEKHPLGIITTRDFLSLLVRAHRETPIEIVAKNLSKESRRIVGGFFNQLTVWSKKMPNLARARFFIKQEKGGGVFKGVLSLLPQKGKPKIIEREGKNLKKVLKQIRQGK